MKYVQFRLRHEQVKEWVAEAFAYPLALCSSFWGTMRIIEKFI